MKTHYIYQLTNNQMPLNEPFGECITVQFSSLEDLKQGLSVRSPDMVICSANGDSKMANTLLNYMKRSGILLPVIVLFKNISKNDAVELIHAGAVDAINVDEDGANQQLRSSVSEALFCVEIKELMELENRSTKKHLKALFKLLLFALAGVIMALLFVK